MEISLRNERGQGVVEYVLVLVVAVSIILGGVYRLNSAFKTWANNYFGNYLACLLETGELPTISGGGGDSGICNQFFKPFSLADGRPLLKGAGGGGDGGGGGSQGSGGGMRETQRSGNGGGAGSYTPVGSFGSFNGGRSSAGGSSRGRTGKMDSTYTGSTDAGSYSGGYSSGSKRTSIGLKNRLDQRFAFDETRENQEKRTIASVPVKTASTGGDKKSPVRIHGKDFKKDEGDAPSSGFTIGDFLKYLIIAAILIAMFVVLGGQGLQISKSTDSSG